MSRLARTLIADEQGQDLIEYAVLASFVALVTFGAVVALGIALNNWLTAIADSLD